MSSCGIEVFADEGVVLPPTMRWGKPCKRGHGADDPRGNLRGATTDSCLACVAGQNARSKGHALPDVSPDALIARSREAGRVTRANGTPPKGSPPAKGKGYTPPGARLTDVVCQREGCSNRLTKIALTDSLPDERYCSRDCAGLLTAPGAKDDADVSDAALAAEVIKPLDDALDDL